MKDRAALYIIRDAEEKGLIGPGGTVVEGTAGNTGIGLAHICRVRYWHWHCYALAQALTNERNTHRTSPASLHT